MRAIVLGLSFSLAACGAPLPPAPVATDVLPPPHITGTIGPVAGIDHDGTVDILDDGERFQATTIVDLGGTAAMTRLNMRTADMQAGGAHVFLIGNEDDVMAVGCAGSAPGMWDIIDAPAEVMRVTLGGDEIIVEMVLRGQTETVTTTIPLADPDA